MQDPSGFQPMKAQFPEQEHLKCPRCDSSNTKFCYYNNYNLSQPRHFCKNCRRYWTKGGTLRNIPVGGGSRKNAKRPTNPKRQNPDPEPARNTQTRRTHEPPSSPPQSVSSSTVVTSVSDPDPTRMYTLSADPERKMLDITGSFSSLLAANSQFGNLLTGLNPNGSGPKMVQLTDFTEDLNVASSGPGRDPALDEQGNNGSAESYLLQGGESNFWGGGAAAPGSGGGENGWPDLAIYTPGSGFQ